MQIDSRLEEASTFVFDFELCQVRLHNNATYPWLLLIPRQNDIVELIDLSANDQIQLMKEITTASSVMKIIANPDKLNVATLGNVVSQMHIHIIGRFYNDPAWPNAVWGCDATSEYDNLEREKLIVRYRSMLGLCVL